MIANDLDRPMYDYSGHEELAPWRVTFGAAPDSLRPFVDSLLSYPGRSAEMKFSRVPEGMAHVVCLITRDAARAWPAESSIRGAVRLVSGPHTTRHPMTIGDETIVAQLRPGAARAVLGIEAAALKNHVVSAEAIWGSQAREALDRIVAAPSRVARMDALMAFLERRVERSPHDDLVALRAAAWMQTQRCASYVASLTMRSGYSDRQMRRKFRESLGMSPKAYARTLRLRSVLRLGRRGADWSAVAAETGFYDQSHLVHEFKEALGLPPVTFFSQPRLSALSHMGILDET